MNLVLPPRPIKRVAVLGLGLIGGSVALRCQQKGYRIVGYDADPATRAKAAQDFTVVETVAEAVAEADLVVLAVPLTAMGQTAQELAEVVHPEATITDVGSVKAPVRAALEAAGFGDLYVGAHPMAGNQHTGYAFADPMLLVGAPWALTRVPTVPITGSSAKAPSDVTLNPSQAGTARYGEVFRWISDTFDASIVELDDAEHDQAQALISGLPHVFAVELLNLLADSADSLLARQLAAGSFRDGTRVAHTDPDRTTALVVENVKYIVPLLRKAADDLSQLADRLAEDQQVNSYFHHADSLRDSAFCAAARLAAV